MTQIFSTGFGPYTFPGDTITAERDGFTITATVHADSHHGAPWEECDGHGPVSDWRNYNYRGYYNKRPGELLLCEDHGRARFYDFKEACRIALRDGWGFLPHPLTIERDTPSNGDYTACGGWARAGDFSAYDPQNFNRAEFTRCNWSKDWHGSHCDTYFSGVLVSLASDGESVTVGRFYS
jgi:hypothetical protein